MTFWSTTCVKHCGIARTDAETEQSLGIYSKLKHLYSAKHDEHVKCLKSLKFDKHRKISCSCWQMACILRSVIPLGIKECSRLSHKIWAITKGLFLALTVPPPLSFEKEPCSGSFNMHNFWVTKQASAYIELQRCF